MYLHADCCSSDDSDVDDGEPQSELMHLLSDRQRESKLGMLVLHSIIILCNLSSPQ